MKQQLKQLMLTALVALCCITASAHDFEVDGIYYNYNDDGSSVSVTYSSTFRYEYIGDIAIPSSVTYNDKTYRVTSIGEWAFYYCSGLTSVTIGNSVTSIGNSAFSDCSGLTSVTIPNSVTSIGSSAFQDCRGLTSITIPESVTKIEYGAFENCDGLSSFTGKFASEDNRCLIVDGVLKAFAPAGLTSYSIPNTVTSIGEWAFFRCYGLSSITIPESVTSIEEYAFCHCNGLTSITIPESVTSIGPGTFIGCRGLSAFRGKFASEDNRCLIEYGELKAFAPAGITSYSIPNTVTSIGFCAFNMYDGVTSTYDGLKSITIPESVTSIEKYAFGNCSGLTTVTIPKSMTSIGAFAFANCYGLTSISIAESVMNIEGCAFRNCSGLTSITIPASVESMESGVFDGCDHLRDLTFHGIVPPSIMYPLPLDTECNVWVPAQSVEEYRSTPALADLADRINAIPDITLTLTMSQAEYATLCLPFNAELPDGLKAYTCSAINGTALRLIEVTDGQLEACTPYIIYGYNMAAPDGEVLVRPELGVMTNTYTFTGSPIAFGGTYKNGYLVGTLETIEAKPNAGQYVLQNQPDYGVGFYRVATTGVTVPANRCYLQAPDNKVRAFTFTFEGDDETAISPVVAVERDAETYSLSGVRVGKGYKGIIIRDGKKYLNR